jgi:hypothetical protein
VEVDPARMCGAGTPERDPRGKVARVRRGSGDGFVVGGLGVGRGRGGSRSRGRQRSRSGRGAL